MTPRIDRPGSQVSDIDEALADIEPLAAAIKAMLTALPEDARDSVRVSQIPVVMRNWHEIATGPDAPAEQRDTLRFCIATLACATGLDSPEALAVAADNDAKEGAK